MIYSVSERWLMVWKRRTLGYSFKRIRRHLGAGAYRPGPADKTIRRTLDRFDQTGDVKHFRGLRARPPVTATFTFGEQMRLLNILLEAPGDMLCEIRDKYNARTRENQAR